MIDTSPAPGTIAEAMPIPTAIAAISGVEARIAAIRTRIGAADAGGVAGSSVDLTNVTPDTSAFDPFGETYQAALEAVQPPAAPPGTYPPAGASSYAQLQTMPGVGATPGAWSSPSASPVTGVAGIGSSPIGPAVSGVPGASIGRIGGFGPMPVPPELAAYGNGRVPTDALVPIGQGGHRLYGPAAEAWRSAVDAAAAEGITLRITDSYRSYDQQVDLVRRKGLYSEGGYGATPGTSNHGWGLAVDADVSDPATLAWIRANGWKFGFVEAVPREPWHWEYRPHQA